MKLKHFKFLITLKSRLLLYFVLVALIVAVIFGAYYYITFKDIFYENIGDSQYKVVTELMGNIDTRIKQINNSINSICVDQNLIEVLERQPTDLDVFDGVKQQAITDVQERFDFSDAYDSISAYYVLGQNGFDLRGGDNAYFVEPDTFENSSWFIKGTQMAGAVLWGNAIKNYTKIYAFEDYNYIIPYYKEIIDIEKNRPIGKIIVFFGPEIFFSGEGVDRNANEQINLVDQDGTIVLSTDMNLCGKSIKDKGYSDKMLGGNGGFFNSDANKKLIVYKKSNYSNWYLVKEISLDLVEKQNKRIGMTVLLIVTVTICFSLLLSLFLSGNFVKPIKRLVKQVNEIAKGHFNQNFESNKIYLVELKELNEGIENMTYNIKDLISGNLRKEDEKKKLELKMLQNQINPHFLYNTLNLVSWMASMQRSYGIKQTIDSLMELLNFATKNINEKTTVKEELEALEHYMNIQRIRYKGKVSFNIEYPDKKILAYNIPKFIIQPIVENSVFHGIEPKNGTGQIMIRLFEEENNMMIEITDDGVGITQEKIKTILENKDEKIVNDRFKEVGLANVNRRIKLICGSEYGLDIESKVGEYTKVIIKLPIL